MISILGVVLQLAGALLLGGVFVLLRAHSRRRPYFVTWSRGWLALAVGSAALATRHVIQQEALVAAEPAGVLVFDLLHQAAMLLFVILLTAGVLQFVRAGALRPLLPGALIATAGYATASVLGTSDLGEVLALQSAVAAPALGWCGLRLVRLPPPRQGVGVRLAALAFVGLALVAAANAALQAGALSAGPGVAGVLHGAATQRAFIELLLHMMLGYGMIVLLMEEAKREIDDAHAQLAVAHNELRRTALVDTVTGTLTRRAFAEGVGLEVAKAGYGAVLMLDMDDLKHVNDEYGHSAGDALLRHLAEVLRPELRPSDKLYRWGGDEFLLVLPGADTVRAEARFRIVLAAAPPLRIEPAGALVPLATSAGSAEYTSAADIAGAIDTADAAMYRAKSRRKFGRSSGTVV